MSQRRNYYHASNSHHHKQNRCGRCHNDFDRCNCKEHHEQGALVEKVVCSQDVQKTAEFLLPAAVGPNPLLDLVLDLLAGIVNVRVTPDFSNIQSEITVIKDQVINFGYIPATLDVEGTILGIVDISLPIQIFFQEHTDCPGACPGDQVIETPPVVDAVLNEPLIATGPNGTSLNLLLFKAVIRTHITVIRQGIERNGKICDLDSRRCDPTGAPIAINSPLNTTANTTALGSAATPSSPAPASNPGNTTQ